MVGPAKRRLMCQTENISKSGFLVRGSGSYAIGTTFEFELKDARIVFNPEAEESDSPEVKNDTEVFCEKCSWHDKFQELKNS
jgi:hypothetical protein